jgi:hypothetical protein
MHCPQLTIGYSQTESTSVVTVSELDDALEVLVSTVGKALLCTEMKIASLIDGTTAAERIRRSLRPWLYGHDGI